MRPSLVVFSLLALGAIVLGCTEGQGTGRRDGGGTGMDASSEGSRDGGVLIGDGGVPDAIVARDAGPGRACVAEVCGNGLDDDCDLVVDNGCSCVPGEVSACFRGDPAARERGACVDGTMLCAGFELGTWGPCEGDVLPGEEVCDPSGVDEDCDGAANEGCECSDGDPPLSCGTDEGACVAGVQRCVAGMLTACEGAVGPGAETCEGTDQDCDARIDEGLTRVCGSDVGSCRTGIQACSAGTWGACVGEALPSTETCDGTDEDCDGMTDEDVRRMCGTDVGRCVAGTETCSGGSFGTCTGRIDGIAETCNGQDDDCDGATDEMLVRSCGSDVGRCVAGTERCASGAWGACTGATGPAASEACDGAIDDDCDGATDEGCGCTTGAMRSCGTDVGACAAGSQTCNASGMWGACTGAVGPRTELCDGVLDEDCDGMRDEGCDCTTGATRPCGIDTGECSRGTETCDATGRWAACVGATGPATEVCNTRDDDCDGMTDEGDICPRFPPTAMCPGARSVLVGDAVMLSGSGSDPDGGSVTYGWTVASRPAGSSATPSPAGAASTTIVPDAAGTWTLRLCVTDDESVTTCCTTMLTVSPRCTPPPVPAATSCGTSWDRRPIVEFPALPSGQIYQLTLDGAGAPYATVTTVGQNYFRPPAAIAPGGPPPGAARTISVRACSASDATCCSAATSLPVRMVEACTTPRAPVAGDLVISEYVIDGDGTTPFLEAGEAFEITNLSNCPITLEGTHFFYCNGSCSSGSYRWMDFGASDIVPPRGVYVAIRDRSASMCAYPFFGPDDPALFGLRISTLAMNGPSLSSGWFNNSAGSFRFATGAYTSPTSGTTLDTLAYSSAAPMCSANGFDALDSCGELTPVSTFGTITPNQLGRLWHPCDAVTAPNPAMCR